MFTSLTHNCVPLRLFFVWKRCDLLWIYAAILLLLVKAGKGRNEFTWPLKAVSQQARRNSAQM